MNEKMQDLYKSVQTKNYELNIESHSIRYKKMFDSINHIIKNDLPKIDPHYAESYMIEMVHKETLILNNDRIHSAGSSLFKLGFHVGSSHIGIHEINNHKLVDRIALIRYTNEY